MTGISEDLAEAHRLMVRVVEGGGGRHERDEAITRYERLIDGAELTPEQELLARAAVGTLLMLRVFPAPLGPDPTGEALTAFATMMAAGALGPVERADADRAYEHLRHVADEAPPGSEVRTQVLGPLAILGLFAGRRSDSGTLHLLAEAERALPPSSQRTMVKGLESWLRTDGLETADDAERADVAQGLREFIAELPPGHQLRTMLAGELAAVLADDASRTGSPDRIAAVRGLLDGTLADADPADPSRDLLTRRLAGMLTVATASGADDATLRRVVELAEGLLAEPGTDSVRTGKDHFLRAMALLLRARRDASVQDLRAAAGDLQRSLELVPVDDELAPVIIATLGGLLNDRHVAGGVWEDADAAAFRLDQALAVASAQAAPASPELRVIRGISTLARTTNALLARDQAGVEAAVVELRAAVDGFTEGHPWRWRFDAVLGLSLASLGIARQDGVTIREGIAALKRAGGAMTFEGSGRTAVQAIDAMAHLLSGLLHDDDEAIGLAATQLAELPDAALGGPTDRLWVHGVEAMVQALRYERGAGPDALDAAIDGLERARGLLAGDEANRHGTTLPLRLADAYWRRSRSARPRAGDEERSLDAGLAGLRAQGTVTLLQTGTRHALTAARQASSDALRLARRCLEAGRPERAVQAVELGRALVLHSSTASGKVATLLRGLGHEELTREWEAAPLAPPPPWTGRSGHADVLADIAGDFVSGAAPAELRRRVLEALRADPAAERLFAAPEPARIARALRDTGHDALVYLIVGGDEEDGLLLVVDADGRITTLHSPTLAVPPDGPVARHVAARARTSGGRLVRDLDTEGLPADPLEVLCDWAWPAAIGPLLRHLGSGTPPRVVVVPCGALGWVPWHAARRRDGEGYRYAVEDLVLSYAASARQLIDVADRPVSPYGANPVLVGDPTGDLPGAEIEVTALRERLHPDAAIPRTPEQVLAHLPGPDTPGASLLHLACHAHAGSTPDESYLRLVGDLPVHTILRRAQSRPPLAPGGLVVLSACTTGVSVTAYDEALTLATAFLAAGATTVVGSLWAVPDATTPHVMYMFHHYLERMPPAEALRAAQLWMLDPERRDPPGIPPRPVNGRPLEAIEAWAAFVHHGR